MATPVQMSQIIRLALGTLSADNAHHSFEHMCRHVAKRRIASNVLPATGPVSAGGDQGRDIETFRTYLADELPFALGFLALASTDVVVFACTIQRDGLRAKFEGDIGSICTQGTRVDRIYIFATANVPTRLRHDLQEWATQQYAVALDIIDGSALAEFLAEPELYWIAQEYLHLPSELAPQVDHVESDSQLPSWYVDLRAYWQEPSRKAVNLGDLFDLRNGLKHAIPAGPARADLDGWLMLMTQLAELSPDAEARLHAIYEIVVARSRGTADLRPAETLIRQFIDEVQGSDDPTLLFNASLLIQFCTSAAALGLTDIPMSEAVGWITPLRRHVDELMERDWGSNTRAALLQVAAHLALHVDYTGAEVRGTATLDDIDHLYESLTQAMERGTLQTHLEPAPVVDLEAAMQHLVDLVELLPDAPAYPIEVFGVTVDLLTPILWDHPLYRHVCDGLDRAVARQVGDIEAGDRCRQRAEALQKSGRLLDALREFHQAKVNWFHGDTLYGALRAMGNIVDIYCALGMYLAAKKYALAMAALAHGSAEPADREFVPMALFSAANMDHLVGAWISSAEIATIAGEAHLAWAPDAGSLERHPYVSEAMKYQAFTAVIAAQTRPEFVSTMHDLFSGGLFDGLTHTREARPSGVVRSEQEWTNWLSDMAGAPFSDVGPRRNVAFHALGVRWTIHCRNERDTVLALEDFTSTIQILLVEFASLDPVLIVQDVDIEVRTYPPGRRPDETFLTRTSEGRRSCLLFLPADPTGEVDDERHSSNDVLHLAFQVLVGNSLLNQQQFRHVMDQAARNGLFSNLEIGRPYRELAQFRTRVATPLADPRHRPLANATHPNPRAAAPHMQPRAGAGPGYSLEKAHAVLAERYEILPRSIRHTIPELISAPHVREIFRDLRDKGWKDWHILNVVVNLTVNHRIALRHGAIMEDRAEEMTAAFHAEAMRADQPNDPQISADEITRDAMEQGIQLVAVSSLHRWGLELHHGTTDLTAIMQLLAERYMFWDDDIPHPDPFDGRLPSAE
ncbi:MULTISPECIES: hypothetical protein [Nocardiaceae]|uniref:Uncharacterized protein n=1 Tax=Rhodococcoides kroppenstedtii TaxID=293050 RepID=A0ABS7NXY5_9NOCA|nr:MULTISPECIES: hypothetical protein [Rhodococcus]AMY20326.1 hypothetical protein A3Q40_02963 [Rhodococcus sp. PBTS 1]MBY6315285.1 hypothetical protein [Rhodococcus kroppenstedtii]MBY6322904.1 hypothetical protein [Rhodococcus kroppenstedtii]MBY6401595.1 hypothetical protein [Rhodococcus kroppenstedtii]